MSLENAKTLLESAVREGPLTGIALAIGRAGEAPRETTIGLAPSTIFDVGTMTQSLATATIYLGLVAKEVVNLNTPASRWWPEFGEAGKDKVTLRHLLKHTSGLPADRDYYKDLVHLHKDWLATERGKSFILGSVAAEDLEYPPTYTLLPSKVGYIALGYIAELITDSPLSDLFGQLVAQPLGLLDISFGVAPEKIGRSAPTLVCPYRCRLLCGEVSDINAWAMGGVAGHAGLFTTTVETVRIATALAGSLKGDSEFMPPPAAADFIGAKARYKLGWEMPDRVKPLCGTMFSANTIGHISRTCTSLWVDLDKIVAVAVFATPQAALTQFVSFLPAIHDAVMK